jgi:pyruvate kinase
LPNTRHTFEAAINDAQEKEILTGGDIVVLTAGTLQGVAGSTDLIKVEVVKAVLEEGIGIGQGLISGKARVVSNPREINNFNNGEILVARTTTAEFVELMRKAAGIITEDESLTSHAAVIGRRLAIPIILGAKSATKTIREGVIVTLDAEKGLVYSGLMNGIANSDNEMGMP